MSHVAQASYVAKVTLCWNGAAMTSLCCTADQIQGFIHGGQGLYWRSHTHTPRCVALELTTFLLPLLSSALWGWTILQCTNCTSNFNDYRPWTPKLDDDNVTTHEAKEELPQVWFIQLTRPASRHKENQLSHPRFPALRKEVCKGQTDRSGVRPSCLTAASVWKVRHRHHQILQIQKRQPAFITGRDI